MRAAKLEGIAPREAVEVLLKTEAGLTPLAMEGQVTLLVTSPHLSESQEFEHSMLHSLRHLHNAVGDMATRGQVILAETGN